MASCTAACFGKQEALLAAGRESDGRQIQGSAAAIYLRQPRDETDDRGREAAGAGTETKAPSTA